MCRWREGTEEAFWAEFSSDGKQFTYTKIIEHLTQRAIQDRNRLVKDIKVKYGERFSASFHTRKHGVTHVMIDPVAIVMQYHKLEGIHNDSDDSDGEN